MAYYPPPNFPIHPSKATKHDNNNKKEYPQTPYNTILPKTCSTEPTTKLPVRNITTESSKNPLEGEKKNYALNPLAPAPPLPALLILSSFLTSASCNLLLAAHSSRILRMRMPAITARPAVRSEGLRWRNETSGVMPISSMRRRSA